LGLVEWQVLKLGSWALEASNIFRHPKPHIINLEDFSKYLCTDIFN